MKNLILILMTVLTINTVQSQDDRSVEEAKGIAVGKKAPLFIAIDADSNHFVLSEEIKKGPVVIIFYRGFWCPVCNKHLASMQDSLKLIEATGARVIAVSPEKPEYLDKMAEKTKAEFTLLYDEDYKIADAYDVTFAPSGMQIFTYNMALGAKLKKTHSDDSQRLPIPATYIVDEEGVIIWRQFDHDYKKRSSVKEILEALK
ncbi:MAG: redoxin domain-containing protein [Bacteroidales bacterium]|nr:redoxin domain-containing protein [Bacteroidales bacterium]